MKKRIAALVGAAALTFATAGVAFAEVVDKVDICHAVGNGTFNEAPDVSVSAIIGGTGHGGHADDIIPPFQYEDGGVQDYPGQNWTDENEAIWANDCETPDDVPTDAPTAAPTFSGGEAELTEPPTDTFGKGTSTPADSAWLLVVALGVLLASIVVLTPARAKSKR